MITTAIGQYIGFGEYNKVGFLGVYVINFLILLTVCIIAKMKGNEFENNKFVQVSLGIVGITRLIVVALNFYSIHKFAII